MALSLTPTALNGSHTVIEDNSGFKYKTSNSNSSWRKTPSGSFMIYDIPLYTDFGASMAVALDVYPSVNSNAGGSGFYRNMAHFKVYCHISWNGQSYTPYVNDATLVSRNTGSLGLTTRIYYDGTDGTTQGEYAGSTSHSAQGNTSRYWSSNATFLRLKFTGWNTSYPSNSADKLTIIANGRPYD